MTERPLGGKDELSRTLRELRSAAELSTRQAAEAAGFSQAKVSRIERGVNVPPRADVVTLLDIYKPPAPVRRRLLALAEDVRAEHRPVVMVRSKGRPGRFQARLARIEAASAEVRAFSPTAVPGVLQTEPYMRGLITYRGYPAEYVDEFVANRKRRQAALVDGDPRFTFITTAGALGWRFGSPEEMARQVEHIAEATQTAQVGIIPWGTEAHVVMLHSFDIYDERAVSYGTHDATAILTAPPDVAKYCELWGQVESMAVFGGEAREVLTRIAAEYRALT